MTLMTPVMVWFDLKMKSATSSAKFLRKRASNNPCMQIFTAPACELMLPDAVTDIYSEKQTNLINHLYHHNF